MIIDEITDSRDETVLFVDLTLGILINKLNRDSLLSLTKKFERYLTKKLKAINYQDLEVNTFFFISCSFPMEYVELPEQRKSVVNSVEMIINDYCRAECSSYSKNIQKNVEIRDITKMLKQLVKKSNSVLKDELVKEIEQKADDIDDRVVKHVSDVLQNSFIAIWDFPANYPDIIMFPDLILKRDIGDKKQNIPLRLLAENLLIMQFGKACVNNLKPILASNEESINLLYELLHDSDKVAELEKQMTQKLWKTIRVIFGLLSSTQQVNNVLLKQIKRISEVRIDLESDVEKLNYGPLEDYLMLIDTIIECDENIIRINKLQSKVKQTYQSLLNVINKFEDLPDEDLGEIRDLSLIFTQALTEIQLMKFYSDKFRDLAYFQTIPTEVGFEEVESIEVDSEVILKGIALFKTYRLIGSTVYALRGVDIEINKGEMVAIVGPSGSGKTTLLNLLSGLDTPNRGAVFLLGKNIDTMSDADLSMFRRKNMGFIFQYYNLIPTLNVLENVMLPALMIGISLKNAKVKALELIIEVDLERFQNQFPIKLSGGQLQRVTVARAMINNPSVIFADEPTGDLDSQTGKKVIDLLRRFSKEQGTAVILVTHDLEMAKTCDRLIQIRDGKIVSD